MRRKLSSIFCFLLIFLMMAGFMLLSGRFSNPYLLKMEKQLDSIQEMDDPDAFVEAYTVKTGDIQENLLFEKIIPEGSYVTRTIRFPSSSAFLTSPLGNLIPSGTEIVRFENGSSFLAPVDCRILSVSKDPKNRMIFLQYLPSGSILLKIPVSEEYLNKLSSRTIVRSEIADQEIASRIVRFSDRVKDHCFCVWLLLKDTQIVGRNGCTVRITLTVQEKHHVLMIPEDCIYHTDDGESFVLIKRGEDTFETMIQTGISDGTMTEILSGLQETDLVLAKYTS